jgi:hypothetical protein
MVPLLIQLLLNKQRIFAGKMLIFFYQTPLEIPCTLVTTCTICLKVIILRFIVGSGYMAYMLGQLDKSERSE